MKYTPLYDLHVQQGAKLTNFHEWILPLQFTSILDEHHHTRKEVSIFDCSHMGKFLLTNPDAFEKLDYVITADVMRLPVGKARYGALVNQDARIVDDVIVVRLAEKEILLVTNAGPLSRVKQFLAEVGVETQNISDVLAKIDVQGPLSRDILVRMGFEICNELRYYSGVRTRWDGIDFIVTRMGYTGELGFELYMPREFVKLVWQKLLDFPEVKPAGLGARDTLRLEMGYPLSGQDFSEQVTPLEASQERFINWQKDFYGKQVLVSLREKGGYSVLCGFKSLDRRAPRHGQEIYRKETKVGVITSGTYGPSVGTGIGLGYIEQELKVFGEVFEVGDRRLKVELVELPFYKDGTCRR